MHKALIETATGRVANVIVLPDNWIGRLGDWKVPTGHELKDAGNVSPGDTWDGQKFTRPEPVRTRPSTEEIVSALLEGDQAKIDELRDRVRAAS
jgi:hypothetical protein